MRPIVRSSLALPLLLLAVCVPVAWILLSPAAAAALTALALLEIAMAADTSVPMAGIAARIQHPARRLFLSVGLVLGVLAMRLLLPPTAVAVTQADRRPTPRRRPSSNPASSQRIWRRPTWHRRVRRRVHLAGVLRVPLQRRTDEPPGVAGPRRSRPRASPLSPRSRTRRGGGGRRGLRRSGRPVRPGRNRDRQCHRDRGLPREQGRGRLSTRDGQRAGSFTCMPRQWSSSAA